MRGHKVLFLLCIMFLTSINLGCPKDTESDSRKVDIQTHVQQQEQDEFAAAEILAKRLVLYNLAVQINDLAASMARPEEIADVQLPELVRQMNEFWWKFDREQSSSSSSGWEGATLGKLPISKISEIEPAVFPLINARLEKQEEGAEWVHVILGFDSIDIKQIIASAHDDWIPETKEIYLASQDDNCMQVWCMKINHEWKILAHFQCTSDIIPPAPPE